MQDYKKKFHSWYQELSFYKQKLRTIVNEPRFRKEVIQFISSHYKDCEYNDYIEHMSIVIDTFRNPKLIIVNEEGTQLNMVKSNPNCYLYWVLKYREHITKIYMLKRPINPSVTTKIPNINVHLSNHKVFERRFLKNNCKYYGTIIEINGASILHKDLQYRESELHDWKTRHRIVNSKGYPSCE
jgi:hypothetical protein